MKHTLKRQTIILNTALMLLLVGCGGGSDNAETKSPVSVEQNTTENRGDNTNTDDDNTSTTPTVPLTSLKLSINKTTLNKDENTTVEVLATYADNSTKVLTSVEWIVTPKESVEVNATTLTAKKDNAATLQAKVGNTLSNAVNLNITWVVDGHTLPPEPDPVENDATLGGVDSNNNGVRDDVERNIYAKYIIPIERVILLNKAQFYQKTMIEPVDNAQEIVKFSIKLGNCSIYLKHIGHRANEWRENREYIKNISFNNTQRIRKYLDYNIALSGGVYGSSPKDWNREACTPEIVRALEEMGK